mmetsp:Transcript_65786/g.146859  ORF Transcript_65786/g.146859 Transcript_65786/m.146859 type:complete len:132 (+) Transcript_65786:1523-1918(+)
MHPMPQALLRAASRRTTLHHAAPLCTSLPHSAPLCLTLPPPHHSAPLCTTLCHSAPHPASPPAIPVPLWLFRASVASLGVRAGQTFLICRRLMGDGRAGVCQRVRVVTDDPHFSPPSPTPAQPFRLSAINP